MERLAASHPVTILVVVYTREAHPGERVPARDVLDTAAASRR